MSDKTAEILAKGSSFIGLLKAIEQLHGSAARERVLADMPEDIASRLRLGELVVMGWYPVGWYAQFHASIDRSLQGGPALARALSHHATASDISSMHRFIVNILSTETLFGQTHRLMGLYWKGGTIERLEIVPGRARMRFNEWHGFTRLIWEDLMGGMDAILETCGAKNGRCRPAGRTPDDDTSSLEIEARWG